jgi:pimeloyl-ACP methyl ester carboxylesterase
VLGAEFDFTSSAEKRRWTALIPGARFVEIPGSRHHSEQDSPVRFNREVLGFFDRQTID